MRAIHAGAAAACEPVLQPRPPLDVSRLPALRLAVPPRAAPQRPFGVLLVDGSSRHRTPLLFQTSQLEIDALVACADMNRMGGFELARRLRRARPDIRVLLMCRHFAGLDEARGAHGRGYPVIEEPFTPEELCRRLTSLLASQRNDFCAEQLDGEDRLILRGCEVFAIGSKKEN